MARTSLLFKELKKQIGELKLNINEELENISNDNIERFLESLSHISDKRNASYITYPIQEILFISFFAVLANANSWIEIGNFAIRKKEWIGHFFDTDKGVPSHDTIQRTLTLIKPDELHTLMSSYIMEIIDKMEQLAIELDGNNEELKKIVQEKEILSIDGKISRGSSREGTIDGKLAPLNTLSAYSSKYGMSLGQEYIDEKTNEIPAAPELIKKLNISGTIVTWDALNTQKDTVKAVIKGKGDYVASLKGNQHNLYQDVKLYFNEDVLKELKQKENCYKKTIEKAHSNTEIREYYITEDIKWIEQKKEWSGLKSIGYERKTIEKSNGEKTIEERYYITSLIEDVEIFSKSVRGHWQVENNLHWHLDFTFKEDANTTTEKKGAKALSIIKRNVSTLLQIVKDYYKMSMSLLRYQISIDFEESVAELFDLLDTEKLRNAYKTKE